MKSLIVYATKHGCTERCANKLKKGIKGEVEILNLKKSLKINIDDYDLIVIGGSIHVGKVQKKVKQFCLNNLNLLKEKKIGLFICCMEDGEKASNQFNEAFPEELIKHSYANGIFGGEFNLEKMNSIEKFIVKKIAKVDKSVSKIKEENINEFISELN